MNTLVINEIEAKINKIKEEAEQYTRTRISQFIEKENLTFDSGMGTFDFSYQFNKKTYTLDENDIDNFSNDLYEGWVEDAVNFPDDFPHDSVIRIRTIERFLPSLKDMIQELRTIGNLFNDKYFIGGIKL